jgi:hypothetical protein
VDAGGAKIVFVTSDTFAGADLGSVAGADQRCITAASRSAALAGKTFKAWIALAPKYPGASGADGFTKSATGYVRTDGTLVAKKWADLVGAATTPLLAPIDRDETGVAINPAETGVWTNVTPNGGYFAGPAGGGNCNGWMAGNYNGSYGSAAKTNGEWTFVGSGAEQPCSVPLHLYCLEQ